jgi:hypothetical protein
MKKKIMKRYRERIGNRETVCISLSMIPKMIKEDSPWRVYYKGWSDKDLKKLYKLLYMSGGHRWMDKDTDIF